MTVFDQDATDTPAIPDRLLLDTALLHTMLVEWHVDEVTDESEARVYADRFFEYLRDQHVIIEPEVIDIVFDGPPGPECGRFVETERLDGSSTNIGEWIDRGNGLWALRTTIMRKAEHATP